MANPLSVDDELELYRRDFFTWTEQQAKLLRARRFTELDLANLAEEVQGLGRSEQAQIESRLEILAAHLLKWKYQPGARSNSWRATITEQRNRISRLLSDSPSLRKYPEMVYEDCYLSARLAASRETGIDFTLFPETPPFTIEEVLRADFWPREPDLLEPR